MALQERKPLGRVVGKGLIVVPNGDKDDITEKWTSGRDIGNFPHPWRGIAVAKPGSGKTNLVANLLLKADPPFERVVVFHVDNETQEYDLIDGAEITNEVPMIDDFQHGQKTLLIVEDIDIKGLKPDERSRLNRLMGYASTHRGVSVLITAQQPSQIPADIRRQATVFFLWPSHDLRAQADFAARIGMRSEDLEQIMRKLMRSRYDFICSDLTPDSPAPLRRGIYEIIAKE